MKLVDALTTKDSKTENGAVTNSTTSRDVLDLFFTAGASRNKSTTEIENNFSRAYYENKELALKVLFWAGDIRGGAGERRFFRTALNWLHENDHDAFKANLQNVAYYNRFDSLFQFHKDESVLSYIKQVLEFKTEGYGLLAKWMPREGKSKNKEFYKAFRKYSKLSKRKYRKLVSSLSSTVETDITNKTYSNINYSQVPSVAFNKYRKAFYRHDETRFIKFLDSVKKGEAKVNAGAIFPYDIYRGIGRGGNVKSIEAQWDSLPNYMEGSTERILPVCDVSGSMTGLPMDISVSLGLYISERNEGVFKDVFMTFSESPKLCRVTGNFLTRVQQLERADWGMNTNLQAVFEKILQAGKEFKVPKKEMPTKILIISDMEFDRCAKGRSNYESLRKKYKKSGYNLPDIIFWNVNSRSNSNFPVKYNQEGVALISGASPSIVKSVLSGEIDPMKTMLRTINSDRYSKVKVG